MLSTVGHAGAVLDLFTAEHPEWGVTAAARRLEMPKSRAHDLLASLTAIGLLEHVPHGCYRLGWRSLALACAQLRTSPLKLQATPIMRAIASAHTAAVALFVWDRGSLLCIAREDPTPPLPVVLPAVGARFRANGTAAGKLLLAHRPSRDVEALLRADEGGGDGFRRPQSVEAEFQRIRARGFAAGRESNSGGTPAVAAAVLDGRKQVVAALSVAGPQMHTPAQFGDLVETTVVAAAKLSRSLSTVQPSGSHVHTTPVGDGKRLASGSPATRSRQPALRRKEGRPR